MSAPPTVSANPCGAEVENNAPASNRLSDFNQNPKDGDDFVDKVCISIINQIMALDKANIEKYSLRYEQYNENEAYITIQADEPPTTQLIQRFSFNAAIYNHSEWGRIGRIYVNGLFVNQKYTDVGSSLLDILKSGLRSLVSIAQLSMGQIELYSVETAVLFYIKQGFMVRDMITKQDPQNKVYSTQKILRFALEENNIEIMKKYAGITQETFLEFIEYLLNNTKYGKFFRAYFESKESEDLVEKYVMESRFIASLFDTNMLYEFVRDPSKARISLKPLTM